MDQLYYILANILETSDRLISDESSNHMASSVTNQGVQVDPMDLVVTNLTNDIGAL